MIDLLYITILVCFIIDVSGFIDQLKQWIFKFIHPKIEYREFSMKPFDCSLCSTWWACLIYLLCTGKFTLSNLVISAILAMLAGPIGDLMLLFREILLKINNKIDSLTDERHLNK